MIGRAVCTLALLAAGGASAEALSTGQSEVIACLGAMGQSTSWAECTEQMFAPCAGHSVASQGHLSCLATEKTAWRAGLDAQLDSLTPQLTEAAAKDLVQLMGSWVAFVGQKCEGVAAERSEPAAAEAARSGCEISEIAGALTQITACAEGQSDAAYCVFRD